MFDQNIVSDIQPLYHEDVHLTNDYHACSLVRVHCRWLVLIGLLNNDMGAMIEAEEADTSFLTGKSGLPLVNIHWVELSVGSILREVLMIQNQIPLLVFLSS
ncbi:hypothetical protein Fmac_021213 [Flemingia macrophylla]|uniref:Uncharacterized protein n=1 Tax=Flemingia macrophylla TaxID=520843 RepID=A0ABD1LWE5_9FABA